MTNRHLMWKKVIFMFIVILMNTWVRDASGLLTVKPQNTTVLAGAVAFLNCSTSSGEGVHWYHGTVYVYAGWKLYSTYKERLKVEEYRNGGTTAFNLVFPSAKPEDAGTYSCRDDQGRGELSSAEMTVFAAERNRTCQSDMKPDGVVIQNDCNIDPDVVQLSCSVTFYGSNPPLLDWSKFDEQGKSNPSTKCHITNNRLMCNTSIIGDRQMNRSSYVCQATELSERTIGLCTIKVNKLLYAFNGKTATTSFVGDQLQCNLETSQSCKYIWRHSDILLSTTQAITPDKPGLYQCEAECNIRGKSCTLFHYANIGPHVHVGLQVSDDDSSLCSTGCVVAICFGIAILVMIIVALIYIYVRRRKAKERRRNENGLELTNREIGTEQERIALVGQNEREEGGGPTLIRTLEHRDKKAVFGVTILGDELFLLSHEYLNIDVYADLKTLEWKREFLLTGSDFEIPWDMQSSSMHNCLYIVLKKGFTDQSTEILKIDREGTVQTKWTTDCIAGRLSVTNEFNVIVTSLYVRRIREYSSDGTFIRYIDLPLKADINNPWVTLKRSDNEYLVSHGNREDKQHRVCICSKYGAVKQYFGGLKGLSNHQLDVPVHMAAYSDGHLLVADKDNSRVLLLSPDLKFLQAIPLSESQGEFSRFPNRICTDEKHKQMFVSHNQWISNMRPWNDGQVSVFDMSNIQEKFNIALANN